MLAVAYRGWTKRLPVYPVKVCNIYYVQNLAKVIQRLKQPSVHSRADEIDNFNFKWLNRLQKSVGFIFFKTLYFRHAINN